MSAVKIKPILFNGDMVRAILDGKKTVTRRVVRPVYKGRPYPIWKYPNKLIFERTSTQSLWQIWINKVGSPYTCVWEPYSKGDILWVRESFAEYKNGDNWIYIYKECDKARQMLEDVRGVQFKWRPSIHMPKEAARIFLRVTNVDVKRLQEMTEKDIRKEGVGISFPIKEFGVLWDSVVRDVSRYGWDANPWVWVIEFERIKEDV